MYLGHRQLKRGQTERDAGSRFPCPSLPLYSRISFSKGRYGLMTRRRNGDIWPKLERREEREGEAILYLSEPLGLLGSQSIA